MTVTMTVILMPCCLLEIYQWWNLVSFICLDIGCGWGLLDFGNLVIWQQIS